MPRPATTQSIRPASTEGTRQISQTIGYFIAFFVLGLGNASLGPTLSGLADHTRSHLSEISFLFTARWLGYLLGSVPGGRLYDRVPGHPLMAGVLTIMAAMMALVPLTKVLWLLTAVLLIVGIAEGTVDVGGNTLLVWVHRHRVGPFMNGLHFCFGAGAFLSPIIIAQAVLISGDITWAYWILALLMLPAGLWLLRPPSPVIQATSKDGPTEKVNFLLVFMIATFFFLGVGAEVSFGGWVFTYATALNLSSRTTAAYLTSAFWGSLTLGRLLAIPIAARLRPQSILLGDLVGCLASIIIILAWPNSVSATWVGILGSGLSMASIFPTLLCLAERRMRITGQITGWFFVGVSAGGMFVPWLIGQLFESIGPRVTMLAILIDMILALGLLAVLALYSPWPTESSSGDG